MHDIQFNFTQKYRLFIFFIMNCASVILFMMNNCAVYIGIGIPYGDQNQECYSFTQMQFSVDLFSITSPTFGSEFLLFLIFINFILFFKMKRVSKIKKILDFIAILLGLLAPALTIVGLKILKGM